MCRSWFGCVAVGLGGLYLIEAPSRPMCMAGDYLHGVGITTECTYCSNYPCTSVSHQERLEISFTVGLAVSLCQIMNLRVVLFVRQANSERVLDVPDLLVSV